MKQATPFHGIHVAIATPFKGNRVDIPTLKRLTRWLIEQGVDGIVPCGTTGEAPTLSTREQQQVVETVVEVADGRCLITAGCGNNNTQSTVEKLRETAAWGADAALVVAPFYNRPPQAGLIAHFRAAAEASALPIVIYNIPGRTAVAIEPETMATICEHPQVIAIKESSGSLITASRMKVLIPNRVSLLAGDDILLLPLLAIGGKGAISAAANIIPLQMKKICIAVAEHDDTTAQRIHAELVPVIDALFMTTNPIPVKAALSLMGFGSADVRLPLVPLTDSQLGLLRKQLVAGGIIA